MFPALLCCLCKLPLQFYYHVKHEMNYFLCLSETRSFSMEQRKYRNNWRSRQISLQSNNNFVITFCQLSVHLHCEWISCLLHKSDRIRWFTHSVNSPLSAHLHCEWISCLQSYFCKQLIHSQRKYLLSKQLLFWFRFNLLHK